MGVTRLDDPLLTWCGDPLPQFCNGCSQPLPAPPGLFIEWAFVGGPVTENGKVIAPRADPDGMQSDQRTEALTRRLGDCSEDGPHITLCIPCAQKIGRDLLEDVGKARYLQGENPRQRWRASAGQEEQDLFAAEQDPFAADEAES